MRFLLINLAAVLLAAGSCSASGTPEHPPREVLERLGEVFAVTRDTLWELNDVFWHRGDYERCIANTRLIAEIDPRDVEAYESGAWLMQNQFRDDEAEAFLRKGLRLNPDVYDLYFALGYFLYMHLRYEESLQYLETAASFEAPFFVWHQLAHAYEHAGLTGESLNIWLQREFMDPEFLVPAAQVDRILRGEPPPNIPETIQQWRQQRREREGK